MKKFKKIIPYVIANAGLFLVGVGLVYGFFYHVVFYKLGLPLLILVGSVMVFITFRIIAFYVSLKRHEDDADSVLIFSKEEKDRVLKGTQTQKTLLPPVGIEKGDLCDAKLSLIDKEPFAKLNIRSVKTKYVDDISKADAMKDGLSDVKMYRERIAKDLKIRSSQEKITLVQFNIK